MSKINSEQIKKYYNDILISHDKLKNIVKYTPLEFIKRLSNKYNSKVYFKREDQQIVRSYKIRGAYNNIININKKDIYNGIVCASAGNHAQGVAYICNILKIKGHIFMPKITTKQKIDKVKFFGENFIDIKLVGNNYDDSYKSALVFAKKNNIKFVHPFDSIETIIGQGTLGIEIIKDMPDVNYIIVPIGGGGLLAGICLAIKNINPNCNILGIDPAGAPKMFISLKKGNPVKLDNIDPFIDGAALKQVGDIPFKIISQYIKKVLLVEEGKVCNEMIDIYQYEGIITEPAGALSVAALEQVKDIIKGKKVVCIISGGNNDIKRYNEIIDRSMIFQKLKYYFILKYNNSISILRQLINSLDVISKNNFILFNINNTQSFFLEFKLNNINYIKKIINCFKQNNISYENINNNYQSILHIKRNYLINNNSLYLGIGHN
ncbi:MAG: threonine ammonia-lyase IlvA [Bacteroides sp.]|nr:MAG: threonine ammonia-lyase IlvA [Bacteroides sp.]